MFRHARLIRHHTAFIRALIVLAHTPSRALIRPHALSRTLSRTQSRSSCPHQHSYTLRHSHTASRIFSHAHIPSRSLSVAHETASLAHARSYRAFSRPHCCLVALSGSLNCPQPRSTWPQPPLSTLKIAQAPSHAFSRTHTRSITLIYHHTGSQMLRHSHQPSHAFRLAHIRSRPFSRPQLRSGAFKRPHEATRHAQSRSRCRKPFRSKALKHTRL